MPTLMVSISGIRGLVGDGLDPQVLVRFTSAYAKFVKSGTVVLGRDSRISGEMVKHIVAGTLMSHGLDVIDIGIVPTPTVLYAVNHFQASGGIQISASHNPNEWNALKLLNRNGEFMTPDEHQELKQLLDAEPSYKRWDELGTLSEFPQAVDLHMESVLNLPFINVEAIRNRKFK
ncbi:partial Phosphoglucosamine mutase, partial [uncultured bacterium]